jgi:hypothetical protein
MTTTEVGALYARHHGRVLAYATKLAGAQGEDVAAMAWKALLTHCEVAVPLAYVMGAVRLSARNLFAVEKRERRKCVALAAGEGLVGGMRQDAEVPRRACRWCGRKASYGRTLCEAHYYRERRAKARGVAPDMAAPIGRPWREARRLPHAEIRRRVAAGEKRVALAREFGTTPAHIGRIVNGRRGGGPRAPRLRQGQRTDLRVAA